MQQAIIDLGSNSIRLTVYECAGRDFGVLFREKAMAGLAGYVREGALSEEGLSRAAEALKRFRQILTLLGVNRAAIFATASLRNISNTQAALAQLRAETGCEIELLSGEEEALCGCAGALHELKRTEGAVIDVGGASTEVSVLHGGQIEAAVSYAVGSLSLYRDCVRGVLPGHKARGRLRRSLRTALDEPAALRFDAREPMICVGGTARAALALARRRFGLAPDAPGFRADQLRLLLAEFAGSKREAARQILRLAPERIHTLVPGMMILEELARRFESREILVCRSGVREGYLCRRILSEE